MTDDEVRMELAELAAEIERDLGGDPDQARQDVIDAFQHQDFDTTPGPVKDEEADHR